MNGPTPRPAPTPPEPLRSAYQRCTHGGHPCPRIYQAAPDTRIPGVRLLNLTLSMLLLYAALIGWVVSL